MFDFYQTERKRSVFIMQYKKKITKITIKKNYILKLRLFCNLYSSDEIILKETIRSLFILLIVSFPPNSVAHWGKGLTTDL